MSDKDKIKQEIERLINDKTDRKHVAKADIIAPKGAAYLDILNFINSLPEEPVSEDLDFLVISLEETIGTSPHSREVIKEYLQKAAEWGRNHFEDKSEMVSEDLENAAIAYSCANPSERSDGMYDQTDIEWTFEAGAKWQKKKDQETIELAEDHAMLAGMNKMKEEMMENAIESIVEDWCGDSPEITIPLNPQDFKTGDKLKILILKTE